MWSDRLLPGAFGAGADGKLHECCAPTADCAVSGEPGAYGAGTSPTHRYGLAQSFLVAPRADPRFGLTVVLVCSPNQWTRRVTRVMLGACGADTNHTWQITAHRIRHQPVDVHVLPGARIMGAG